MSSYQYEHFERGRAARDTRFVSGPSPGRRMPDFDLKTTQGRRLTLADVLDKPVLLVCASITCPMTRSATPILRRLHREHGDRINFLTLYVREAHPGDRYPQPSSPERKLAHARAYQQRDQIPWPVLVDDVEGSLHRSLDPKPNAAYFIHKDGVVAFRTLWANDAQALRKGIQALSSSERRRVRQRQHHLVPLLSGAGSLYEVLHAAGPQAERDARRQAPPLYAMGRIAAIFKPLPPLGRGVAALGLMLAATSAAGIALVNVVRRMRTRHRYG